MVIIPKQHTSQEESERCNSMLGISELINIPSTDWQG